MSGARFLMVAASVAVFSLPWISTVADAESLQVNEKVGQAIENHRAQAPPSGPATGGETPATATPIVSFPFSDSGNTCGHTHDYTASCGDNNAPDLFYRYVPAATSRLALSMCGSGYDTVLYVLENGVEIACNDDFCGLQSEVWATVVAGRTYIIGGPAASGRVRR
jgi:hypothetical protein